MSSGEIGNRAIAELALKLSGHAEQLETAATLLVHLPKIVRGLAEMDAIRSNVTIMQTLTPDICRAALRGYYVQLSDRHGGTPEIWGLIAGMAVGRQPQNPVPTVPRARHRPLLPATAETRAAAFKKIQTLILKLDLPSGELISRLAAANLLPEFVNAQRLTALRSGAMLNTLLGGKSKNLLGEKATEQLVIGLELLADEMNKDAQ